MVSPRLYNGTKAGKMVHSNLHNRPQFIRKKREQYPFGSYTYSNVYAGECTLLFSIFYGLCSAKPLTQKLALTSFEKESSLNKRSFQKLP